mmetsp:Transcript_86394/g.268825  ORF Transcript_86394/g.268825 Transcript_86394/m.268825 type:complete len:106 (+) Transcript_86394:640-957(+)
MKHWPKGEHVHGPCPFCAWRNWWSLFIRVRGKAMAASAGASNCARKLKSCRVMARLDTMGLASTAGLAKAQRKLSLRGVLLQSALHDLGLILACVWPSGAGSLAA